MVVGFARNLYWALPLLILPFVYVLYAYKYDAHRKRQILFWGGLVALLYLRYLCGYEYITTITIMVAAAVVYYLFLAKGDRKMYVQQIALVFAASFLAFALAIGTHVMTLRTEAGSISGAASIIKDRAMTRTTQADKYLTYPIMGLKSNLNEYYQTANSYLDFDGRSQHRSQLWAAVASLMNYALMPVVNIPVTLNQPFATYIQSLTAFVAVLVFLYVTRARWVERARRREVDALFLGAAAGLVGLLSWLVLARSHSLVHGHINGILLYLPFALFGFTIIGLFLEARLVSLRRMLKK
jgi:hypothetical protein